MVYSSERGKTLTPAKNTTKTIMRKITIGKNEVVKSGNKRKNQGKEENRLKTKRSRKTTVENDKEVWENRMSPSALFKLVKLLDDRQRREVEEIGFGHLLTIKISRLPYRDLCMYLVNKFSYGNLQLELEKGVMPINDLDVECVLGLPRGPRKVEEGYYTEEETEEYKSLVKAMWRRFNISRGGPRYKALLDACFKGDRIYGDEFKRYFIMYVVSTFLNGVKGYECKYKVMKSLIHVDHIQQYNWCEYVLDGLTTNVCSWKKNYGHFQGCITFLVVIFLSHPHCSDVEILKYFLLMLVMVLTNFFAALLL